jgi:hypothetical protein
MMYIEQKFEIRNPRHGLTGDYNYALRSTTVEVHSTYWIRLRLLRATSSDSPYLYMGYSTVQSIDYTYVEVEKGMVGMDHVIINCRRRQHEERRRVRLVAIECPRKHANCSPDGYS